MFNELSMIRVLRGVYHGVVFFGIILAQLFLKFSFLKIVTITATGKVTCHDTTRTKILGYGY